MASEHTQIFGLSQWSLSDDVRMEDFNADNLRLETALTRAACLCTGSYTGDGAYGAEHPNALAFDFAPVLVIVTCYDPATGEWFRMVALRGAAACPGWYREPSSSSESRLPLSLTWGTNGLSWYGGNQLHQGNRSGAVYTYAAFGLPAVPSV